MKSIFSLFILDHAYQVVQPIVDAKTKEVHFFELLTRVIYNNQTYMPIEFISDMSPHMKYSLAKKLFYTISKLQRTYPTISFSLNISSLEIEMGIEAFIDELMKDKKTAIDPSRCIIEITEHSQLKSNKIFESILSIKERFGFRFALDDFGSEYATFKQLYKKGSGFDYVKIDGSMVKGIDKDQDIQNSLRLIVDLIKLHGKKAIVEYVSTEQEMDAVIKTANPDYLQGYHLGEPRPIETYIRQPNSLKNLIKKQDFNDEQKLA